jgi:hypothetical protein
VVTVLWWVLPGPCFGACGAAANSRRMAALSPAKLEEGEEPLVLRLYPQDCGRSSWTTAIPVRGASLLREELVRPQRTTKGKESTHSLPLSIYSASGALQQDPGRAAEFAGRSQYLGKWESRRACVVVDVWVSRDVEPPVGLAVRLRALGAQVRGCAPPACAEQLAETQPC